MFSVHFTESDEESDRLTRLIDISWARYCGIREIGKCKTYVSVPYKSKKESLNIYVESATKEIEK